MRYAAFIAQTLFYLVAAGAFTMPACFAEQSLPSAPPKTNCTAPSESDRRELSGKLADSKGVLCPPSDVDPEIRKSAPGGGDKMPVIKPPTAK